MIPRTGFARQRQRALMPSQLYVLRRAPTPTNAQGISTAPWAPVAGPFACRVSASREIGAKGGQAGKVQDPTFWTISAEIAARGVITPADRLRVALADPPGRIQDYQLRELRDPLDHETAIIINAVALS